MATSLSSWPTDIVQSCPVKVFRSKPCSLWIVLDDAEKLSAYDVIIPNWTMGSLSPDQAKNLVAAVKNGCGLAGIHGGMGETPFVDARLYEWMVGGHFVGHPSCGRVYRAC